MAARKPAAKPARAKPGPKPRVEGPTTDGEPLPTVGETATAFDATAATLERSFKFQLMDGVEIKLSKECGHVRARAEYVSGSVCYLVAYKSARGEFCECWLEEDLIVGNDL